MRNFTKRALLLALLVLCLFGISVLAAGAEANEYDNDAAAVEAGAVVRLGATEGGAVYYSTLADAIAAIPTDGEGEIYVLADFTDSTTHTLANKKVTIASAGSTKYTVTMNGSPNFKLSDNSHLVVGNAKIVAATEFVNTTGTSGTTVKLDLESGAEVVITQDNGNGLFIWAGSNGPVATFNLKEGSSVELLTKGVNKVGDCNGLFRFASSSSRYAAGSTLNIGGTIKYGLLTTTRSPIIKYNQSELAITFTSTADIQMLHQFADGTAGGSTWNAIVCIDGAGTNSKVIFDGGKYTLNAGICMLGLNAIGFSGTYEFKNISDLTGVASGYLVSDYAATGGTNSTVVAFSNVDFGTARVGEANRLAKATFSNVTYTAADDAAAKLFGAFFRLGATEGGKSGEVYFTTLNDAVTAAASDSTIYMLADAAYTTNVLLNGKAVTLTAIDKDLTLTTSVHMTLYGDASITIKDMRLSINNKFLDSYNSANGNTIALENVDVTINNPTKDNSTDSAAIRVTAKVSSISIKGCSFTYVGTNTFRSIIFTNKAIPSLSVEDSTFDKARLLETYSDIGTTAAPATLTDVTSNIGMFYVYSGSLYADIFGGSYAGGFCYGADKQQHTIVLRVNPEGDKATTFSNADYLARTNPDTNQTATVSVYLRNATVTPKSTATFVFYGGVNDTATFTVEIDENVIFNGSTPLTSGEVTVTYLVAPVSYDDDDAAIADGAFFRVGSTEGGELGKVYFKSLHEAVAAAASGSTITVLADASLSPTIITDKALTIVGSEKHTLTLEASGTYAFQLLGTETSLTLNNLVIDASQTTSNNNAFIFGAKNGATSGTYAFTFSSVDVKWKAGTGAIYGYHSVKADITLTDCSFEGGTAIINTVAAATNVTMHLDNVTRVGSVAEVYSGAVVTVTRPAVNYTSDAEAIAGGAFFRLGATEGGLLGEVYFTTLNDAVAKAASGSTIYVIADATYTTNFNLNAKAITVAGVSKSIKLTTSVHITLTGDASITFKDITLKISNKMLDSYTATNGNSITFNNVDATVTFVTDKNNYPIRVTSKVAINFTNSTFANETTALRTFIYCTTNAVVTSMNVTSCTFTNTRLLEGQGSCKVGTAAAPMTLTDVTTDIALFYIYSCSVYVDVFGGTYTNGFSYGGDNNAHTFVVRINPTGEKTTTFNTIGYIARTKPLESQTSTVSVSMRNMTVNGNNTTTGTFYSGGSTATFSLIFDENVVFNGTNPVTEVANGANFTITAPNMADDATAVANKLYFRVGAAANKVYTPDLASALHAAAATGDTIYVLANVTLSSKSYISGKTVTVEGVNADITITMPAKTEMLYIGDDAHITFKNINVVADRFVVFNQSTSGKTASLTLENGAHITNHDLAVDNDILIYNGQANANITVNIKAGASAIVTSKTAVTPSYAVVYSGKGVSTTLNVWGTLKNLAQAPDGKNAQVFIAKGGTNNATLNIYEGAVIEGTSDSEAYTGNYSGIVYFSEATNVINISGGTIIIHGNTGFAYVGLKATITISGGTIKNDDAKYAMFFGANQSITVTGGTINCNDRQLLNSGTTVYTLENDAAAIAAGAVARISSTEGGTYYGSISAAIAAAANGDTIYVIRNHASGNIVVSNKRVTVTGLSKDITVTNTEGASSIFLALYDGADITFTNIHFNVTNRFGRSESGTASLVFGDGAKVTTNNSIFFYANGSTSAATSNMTIKFLKGSVIKSTVAMSTGLIYHNQSGKFGGDTEVARLMNLTLYIAGTLDFPSGPVYKDHNKNGTHTVYYDAKNANVTTSSAWFVDVFRTKVSDKAMSLYATGFATTADAAAWAYSNTPATGMTFSADPAAEWAYTFIYADQFSTIQTNTLNTYGGEIWVLRNNTSFYKTATFTDMGTVTIKSYNGATFAFQDASRIQITNTTLILDGIQLTVNSTATNGAGHIKLNAGTAAKPSVLKLVNGAKITGPAWNNGQFVYLSGAYASLYVDETSSIVENASADAMANNNTVIYASTAWANGSITIKGTVSSAAEAAGLNTLIKIEGAANNTAIVLDGAKLEFTGAPGNKSAVYVVANTFNGSLEMKNGAVAAPLTGFVATNEAGVLFGSITGAVAYVADGATETITLTAPTETGATTTFANKNITIVAASNILAAGEYHITYTGGNVGLFNVQNKGTLTLSGLKIASNGTVVRYSTTASSMAQADRDIEINFVDTDVTVTIEGNNNYPFVTSNGHYNKDDATTKSDSITVNIDADSVINYTTASTATVHVIAFNHNSHTTVALNLNGMFYVTVTGDTTDEEVLFYFVRSNNPSKTTLNVNKGATLNITLPTGRQTLGKTYLTSCTGGNVSSNKINLHLDAISDNGALTLGGVKMFSGWQPTSTFDVKIIADDTTMDTALATWVAYNVNYGSVSFTETPIAFRTKVGNEYVYGTLNTVFAAAEDNSTITVIASIDVFRSALLTGKTVTLTALDGVVITNTSERFFLQVGSNSDITITNLKYQGNNFIQFANSNGPAVVTLGNGTVIEGGDPTTGYMITTLSDAKSDITFTIGKNAEVVRPASFEATASTKEMFYLRSSATCDFTLNIYGKLANLTAVADGLNAPILDHCLVTATVIINIYDGAHVEGTSDSPNYSGEYQGIFYFASGTSVNNATYLNILGGTIISHGINPLAYFYSDSSNVRIEGSPVITMTELAYGLVWFGRTTGTSLSIGLDDGAIEDIDINGKKYYCGKEPVIYAISGVTDEYAISQGMIFRMDGVYYSSLADAITLIPDGGTGTIYVLAPAAVNSLVQITNKNVTIIGTKNASYDLTFTGAANSVFFKISSKGSLTLKDLSISTCAQLVNYDANIAVEGEQADKNITVDIINCNIVANMSTRYSASWASVATLIGSSNHYAENRDGCGEQGNAFTLNIDKDTTIDFTSSYTGATYFISLNHNNHPKVTANISATIVIRVTDTTAEAVNFVCSNNPSHTTINITEDAQITMTVAAERLAKTAFIYFTGGNITTNKLTIHINAITDDNGVSTLPAVPLYSTYSTASSPDLCIIANSADAQASILALQAVLNTNGTPIDYTPALFHTVAGGKYYYGTLGAMFAAAENNGTITVLTSGNLLWSTTLSGKAVTLTGATDAVLTNSASIVLAAGAKLTIKDLTILAPVNFISVSAANTELKLENLTITASGANMNFIQVNNGGVLAAEAKNIVYTTIEPTPDNDASKANSSRFIFVNAGGTLATLKIEVITVTAACLVYVNGGLNAVAGSATNPIELHDVNQISGTTLYAYTGTIYANIYGGTFNGALIYGGDGSTNKLDIKINPTGDKITTVSREGTSSSVYSAWVHLKPGAVESLSFTIRNLSYTDTGAAPLFAIRAAATLSISVESSTFNLTGSKLSGFPAASGAKFNSDATAKFFGFNARIGEEGSATYFWRLDGAANAAPAGNTTTTIYVIGNITSMNIGGDNPAHFAKKIIITSAEGEGAPYTVTVDSSVLIAFYVGTGAEVTLTNIIYNVPQRFGRFDGNATFTFGDGCVVNQSNAIFFYDNGNCKNPDGTHMTDAAYTIDIQKGATINCGTAFTHGLHYKSDKDAPATVTVKIAGIVNMTGASYLVSDPGNVSKIIIYYDATTASVTSGQSKLFADTVLKAITDTDTYHMIYAKGFETHLDAAAWGYTVSKATAMTFSANPDREWCYTFIYHSQLVQKQYNVLDSYGGEMWQLRSVGSSRYSMYYTDLGTITLKSYNGATIHLQDAGRMQVKNTTLIIDGVAITIGNTSSNGVGYIAVLGGSAEKPSVLKLVNGAQLIGTAYKNGYIVYLKDDNGGGYSHFYMDADSSIVVNAATEAVGGYSYVVRASSSWANGSVVIEGTITTYANGTDVAILCLNGNGKNDVTLNGATLINAGTASGTASILSITGGCQANYENLNNSTLSLTDATAATKQALIVRGAMTFKGYTGDEAAALAEALGLTVRFGDVFSQVISTAIINLIPEGGSHTFVLSGTTYIYDPVEIYNRHITFIGTNNAEYDLKFGGAADSVMFIIVTNGSLTLKNVNISTNAQLVSYNANKKVAGAMADKNIVINLENAKVDITISSRYSKDAGYAGALISSSNHYAEKNGGCGEQSNSITVNIDKDTVINYTSTYANSWLIAFNHNPCKYVYANIYGTVNMTTISSSSDASIHLIHSNNPGYTEVMIGETAKVLMNFSASSTILSKSTAYIATVTTGTSKMTIYLSAFIHEGELKMDGLRLFSAHTTSCAYQTMIIADDATFADQIFGLVAYQNNGGTNSFTENPLAASLAQDGKVYFSSLGGIIGLIPEGGSATIEIKNQVKFSSEIGIHDRNITIVGAPEFQGDYHLMFTGAATKWAFAIYGKGTLTLKDLRIHTTGILVDFNANKKVSGAKADKNTYINLINTDVVAEGSMSSVFASRNHYTVSGGSGEQSNKVLVTIDADSSIVMTTSTTGNIWFFSFNHNTHVEMNAYVYGSITLNATGTPTEAAERTLVRVNNPSRSEIIFYKGSNLVMNMTDNTYKHYIGVYWTGSGNKLIMDIDAITDNGELTLDGALLFCASPASCIPTIGITGAEDDSMQDTFLAWQGNFGGITNDKHNYVTPIAFRAIMADGKYAYGCIGGAAYAAPEGGVVELLIDGFNMTPTTISNKTITLRGAEDGYIVYNNTNSYLLNISSGAHLTIEGLTFIGNRFAAFTAAADTTASLTLAAGTLVEGGENETNAHLLYADSMKGTTTINIEAGAAIIRPDTYSVSGASATNIFQFASYGHIIMNVRGELKNLTQVDDGYNASIGYTNIQGVKLNANDPYKTGMILNVYPGAEIEGTNDSSDHNNIYQGMFYFAAYGANKHEFNIYGGTITSHGMNPLAYFGNNWITVRIQGTPYIYMNDLGVSANKTVLGMLCLHNTKGYAESEVELFIDVEEGADIQLNNKAFFFYGGPEVSRVTAGKYFNDSNAAKYGIGYRVVDENGTTWYAANLASAVAMSRNGGVIELVGDVMEYGANITLDKYLYLRSVEGEQYSITMSKVVAGPVFYVTTGTTASPVRMYVDNIDFKGSAQGTLFMLGENAHGIFEMNNCSMNGNTGIISLTGAAVAEITLNKGNYTVYYTPISAVDYANITVNAFDITFVANGTGDENSLIFLAGSANGTYNIKGGSATTKGHTIYTRSPSVATLNIENFSIVSGAWAIASQGGTTWYVNLTNVNMHSKAGAVTRLYATKGSYINIMGGTYSSATKDGTNPAVMTFGGEIEVNVYDAYVNSAVMSAITGLAKTVNITIYGGTYIYSGTEAKYAPIMLPKEGNLTVKGGTFVNTSGLGPVFSNTAYSANVLTLEAYNAISNSSNLILNFASSGTPTANLGAYGRLTLNSLAMTTGARPAFVGGDAGAMTFKSTVSASSYEYMQSLALAGEVKFGMLVIPTELLANGVNFTHAGLAGYSDIFGDGYELGVDYFDYKAIAADLTFEADGCVTIELTHTNISADNYNTKYSVVFYAEYEVATPGDGAATVYRYADYEEAKNARALADVAYAAYRNTAEGFTPDQMNLLSTWCGNATETKTLDIYLVAGGSNAVGNTPYTAQYAESIINHVCTHCGAIADAAEFAGASFTCANKLAHGKALTYDEDKGIYFCTCGYTVDVADVDPDNAVCAKTVVCGAKKATFQNVLKNPTTNVFYSGIVSQRAPQDYGSSVVYATMSKYTAVGSAPTLGLGWTADMIGPEYGMATELANHYTGNNYAAIMKYAMNDAALVAEDPHYGNFSGELFDSFMQMVADQIAIYSSLGYTVNVAGLYWMQGEADLANSATYAAALQKFIEDVRTELSSITGTDLSAMPVVVGEVATFTGTTGNANRVAVKNAQNTVTGVMIDQTSLYMADTNGIFLDAQNVADTGARVAAMLMNATNSEIDVPEIQNTTVYLDSEGNEIEGTGHTSLAMSLIAAPSGTTIALTGDQTIYASMALANRDDIVINGDGNTITVVTDAPAIALQNASVTLKNVVIEHTGSSAAITLDQSSTLTVEEGTAITAERTAIEMNGNASTLVINGGSITTTADDATTTDAIIRTSNANVSISGGTFTAATGSSILVIEKNAAHKLIVNITGGTFVTEDTLVPKVDADGDIIPDEYDTIEAVEFVNYCPTAILVIDPVVLAAHPELNVFNAATYSGK